MITTDEDLFICDMAETYHIFDYKSIPINLLATLANGLRESSRIKCKMADIPIEINTFFMIGIFDKLNWIAWSNTEDARKNINCPEPVLPKLLGNEEESKVVGFATPEEFEAARQRIIGGK